MDSTNLHTGRLSRAFPLLLIILFAASISVFGQSSYTPLTVSGFNQDIVAESGISSLAVTTAAADGSNNCLYTQGFAISNGFSYGLPNTGLITSGSKQYQLATYSGNNALLLSAYGATGAVSSGALTLATPAQLSAVSIAGFGSEGNMTLRATLNYTDGTSYTSLNVFSDWYSGNPYILSTLGRIPRQGAPPYTVDGPPSNPRIYSWDIVLPCADQGKTLASINFEAITGSTALSRGVILAVSGAALDLTTVPTISSSAVPAHCGADNGQVSVSVTGGVSPFYYYWNTPGNETTPSVSGLAAGDYTCTIKDSKGCGYTVNATVSTIDAPVLAITPGSPSVCAGSSVTLSVTATAGSTTGTTWMPGGQSGPTITVTPTGNTTYTVSGQDVYGCSAEAHADVTIAPLPSLTSTNLVPAHCGLDNGEVHLDVTGGTAPFTYVWDPSIAAAGPDVTGLASGDYSCTVTDANGCPATLATTVAKVQAPAITASASRLAVCLGVSTELSAVPTTGAPVDYSWAPGDLTGSSITVTPSVDTRYEVTSTDAWNCIAKATIDIVVTPPPVAGFGVDPAPGCIGDLTTISFTGSAGSDASFNWNGFAGAAVESGSGAGPYTLRFPRPDSYMVQLDISENGCTSSYTGPVVVEGVGSAPVVSVASVDGNSITVSWPPVAGATGYEVSVNGASYTSLSSSENQVTILGLPSASEVQVDVIALGGAVCAPSQPGTVSAFTRTDILYLPNAFTPNGDGVNDVLRIQSAAVTSMQMQVFNKWGLLVFSSSNPANGWNGTYKGQAQPAGTYVYTIRLALTDGRVIVRKGTVNLIR